MRAQALTKAPLLLLAVLVGSHLRTTASSIEVPSTPKLSRVVTCAFSNPRYSGWCRVTEDLPEGMSADGICRDILGCLNDVGCTKTYCNATEIRGGWRLEQVDTR
jgi:hypothetical protein